MQLTVHSLAFSVTLLFVGIMQAQASPFFPPIQLPITAWSEEAPENCKLGSTWIEHKTTIEAPTACQWSHCDGSITTATGPNISDSLYVKVCVYNEDTKKNEWEHLCQVHADTVTICSPPEVWPCQAGSKCRNQIITEPITNTWESDNCPDGTRPGAEEDNEWMSSIADLASQAAEGGLAEETGDVEPVCEN
jgi:hypothetical protein